MMDIKLALSLGLPIKLTAQQANGLCQQLINHEKSIAELEKERDVRDLEQQAKGVERVLCENSLSLVKRERMVLKRIMKQLHEKAKALKEREL